VSLTFFSLGASIKMSGLLWAPGVAAYLISTRGLVETLQSTWGGILVQFLVAIPFLSHPWHYIHRSFELDRTFTWFNVYPSMCLTTDPELEIPPCADLLLLQVLCTPTISPSPLGNIFHPYIALTNHAILYPVSVVNNSLLRHRFLAFPPLQLLYMVFPSHTIPLASRGLIDSLAVGHCDCIGVGLESMARI
jgi:ALG3 protein